MDIFGKYAEPWKDKQLGFGNESYDAAIRAGLTNQQLSQGLAGKRVGKVAARRIAEGLAAERSAQISNITSGFETAMQQQAQMFAEQQRKQEQQMQEMRDAFATQQQQFLQAQTRQAAKPPVPQVATPSKSMVIRSLGSARFGRPELQIRSMNV